MQAIDVGLIASVDLTEKKKIMIQTWNSAFSLKCSNHHQDYMFLEKKKKL